MKTQLKYAMIAMGAGLIAMSAEADLVNGLQGYWQMEDGTYNNANTTITAEVGSNGTFVWPDANNRSLSGKIDNAIRFWNSGPTFGYADMGTGYGIGSGSYTMNLWWSTGSTTTTQGMMNDGNWGSSVNGLSLYYNGSNKDIYARFRSDSNANEFGLDIGSIATSTWYMLTMTVDRDANTLTLYHNGGAASSFADITGYGSLDGAYGTYFGQMVSGGGTGTVLNTYMTMDEIGIWNRALTTSEISQLYNGGAGLVIPEPATLGMLGVALVGLFGARRFFAC